MNKKWVLIAISALLLLIAPTVYSQEATPETNTPKTIEYVVSADSANLRSGPGTNFGSVGKVLKGESLLVYDEPAESSGWLKIYRPGNEDAYIADFLVEKAPLRFFPADQKPLFEATGHGKSITEVYDIPRGAYRIDASVEDRAFILKTITVEGDCDDDTIFNELDLNGNQLSLSGLFISSGCSIIFETDNVDGKWSFAVRDVIVDKEFLSKTTLVVEDGTSISGKGRTLTMPTLLEEGIWTLTATVDDNAYILRSQVLSGDCDNGAVLNEFDPNANTLELSTVYQVPTDGCIVFWETENVESNWELRFAKIR